MTSSKWAWSSLLLLSACATPPPAPTAASSSPPAPACRLELRDALSISPDLPSFIQSSVDVDDDGRGYATFMQRNTEPPDASDVTRSRPHSVFGRSFDLRARTLGPLENLGALGLPVPVVAGSKEIAVFVPGDAPELRRLGRDGRLARALVPSLEPGTASGSMSLMRNDAGFALTWSALVDGVCQIRMQPFGEDLQIAGPARTLVERSHPEVVGSCLDASAVQVASTPRGVYVVYPDQETARQLLSPDGSKRGLDTLYEVLTLERREGLLVGRQMVPLTRGTLELGYPGGAPIATLVGEETPPPRGPRWALMPWNDDTLVLDSHLDARMLRGRDLQGPVRLAREATEPRPLRSELLAFTSNANDRNELVVGKLACGAADEPPRPPSALAPLVTQPGPSSSITPRAGGCELHADPVVTLDGVATAELPAWSVEGGNLVVAWSQLDDRGVRMSVLRLDGNSGKAIESSRLAIPKLLLAPQLAGSGDRLTLLGQEGRLEAGQSSHWATTPVSGAQNVVGNALFASSASVSHAHLLGTDGVAWRGGELGALRVRALAPNAPVTTLQDRGVSGDIRSVRVEGGYILAWTGLNWKSQWGGGLGLGFARVELPAAGPPRVLWAGTTHAGLMTGRLGELAANPDGVTLPIESDYQTLLVRVSLQGAVAPDVRIDTRSRTSASGERDVDAVSVTDDDTRFCARRFDFAGQPLGADACFNIGGRLTGTGGDDAIRSIRTGDASWVATRSESRDDRGLLGPRVQLRRLSCAQK